MSADTEYFEVYKYHASMLRTWLVAYGIGAPVIVLTNEHIWLALQKSKYSSLISWLYLIGVAIQICITAINKYVMWASYYGESHPEFLDTKRYRLAKCIRGLIIIDFIIDLGSILLFSAATLIMLFVLVK